MYLLVDVGYDEPTCRYALYVHGRRTPIMYRVPGTPECSVLVCLGRPCPALAGRQSADLAEELDMGLKQALGYRKLRETDDEVPFAPHWRDGDPCPDRVLAAVEYLETGGSVLGYNTPDRHFVRLTFTSRLLARRAVWLTRNYDMPDWLADVLPKPKWAASNPSERFAPHLYDCDAPLTVRFLSDTGFVGCGWFDIGIDGVLAPVEDSAIRLLAGSFDIECAAMVRGRFPVPTEDPVIMISFLFWNAHSGDGRRRCLLTWRLQDPSEGYEILEFADERAMLCGFAALVRDQDPDLLTGYNILNFDFPYLFQRADHLGILEEFSNFGRDAGVTLREETSQSRAFGATKYYKVLCPGRVVFDLLVHMRRAHKLSSYSLNTVSKHFLGEQKDDLPHTAITPLWEGTPADRLRLGNYCVRDADLVQRLVEKLSILPCLVEMARVTRLTLQPMLYSGQRIKVLAQLMHEARLRNRNIPHAVYYAVQREAPDYGAEDDPAEKGADGPSVSDTYQGATVLPACVGYYGSPVTTLDFASLYPSIMIAHNICYSTILVDGGLKVDVPNRVGPHRGIRFVDKAHEEGLLPAVLRKLLAARAVAKRALKAAKERGDAQDEAIQEGRQLALKVSCNSVYGFMGVTFGNLSCTDLAATVTAHGRAMIELVRDTVLGAFAGSRIVYGDTDSVMIHFGDDVGVDEAFRRGKQAEQLVNAKFAGLPPISIVLEKVFCPYLLVAKKRYAGVKFLKPGPPECLAVSGLEIVRRDNCRMLRDMLGRLLCTLLGVRDMGSVESDGLTLDGRARVRRAVEEACRVVADMWAGRVPFDRFIITKAWSKPLDQYAFPERMAHLQLAARMRARDPGTAPRVGDRIPFVVVAGTKGEKLTDRAEDPMFALRNALPLDYAYYVEHQLQPSVGRILSVASGGRDAEFAFPPPAERRVVASTTRGIGAYFAPKRRKVAPEERAGMVADIEDCLARCRTCTPIGWESCANHDCDNLYAREVARQRLDRAGSE